MAKFCSLADVILPNFTEAAYLLKEDYVPIGEYDKAYVEGLLKRLAGLGAKNVVLTGVSFEKDKLGVAVYDGKDIYYDFNDYLPVAMHGTGDVFASAFTGAVASGKTILEAAALAADFVVDSIKATESTHNYGVRFEKALHSIK
jgi:pyridoxine kinase